MANTQKEVPIGEKDYLWLEKGLAGLGFFAKLDLKVLSGILPCIRLASFPKGRAVVSEGERGHCFYLIYKGGVEVRKVGWDKPVARLGAGQFFGEMALLFNEPRSATVRTTKPTLCFRLHSADFNTILRKNPSMASRIRRIAAARRRELARH